MSFHSIASSNSDLSHSSIHESDSHSIDPIHSSLHEFDHSHTSSPILNISELNTSNMLLMQTQMLHSMQSLAMNAQHQTADIIRTLQSSATATLDQQMQMHQLTRLCL